MTKKSSRLKQGKTRFVHADTPSPSGVLDASIHTTAREDTGPFDAFTTNQFEAWLRAGFEGYFLEDADIWAFPGAEGILAGPEHLVTNLGKFYLHLKARQQGRFRQAIADLLSVLPSETRYIPLFEYLLSLAVDIQAYEVLPVLTRVGNGFFGLTQEDGTNLFAQALLAVAQLSAPRREAVHCLDQLIGSTHFDHAFSGVALTALCVSDPDNLLAHMERMRKPLAAMFLEFDTDEQAKQDLAESIMESVGWGNVVKLFPSLTYVDREPPHTIHDAWLTDALLKGLRPLLCGYRTTASVIHFHLPECMDHSVSLPNDGSSLGDFIYFYNTCIAVRDPRIRENLSFSLAHLKQRVDPKVLSPL